RVAVVTEPFGRKLPRATLCTALHYQFVTLRRGPELGIESVRGGKRQRHSVWQIRLLSHLKLRSEDQVAHRCDHRAGAHHRDLNVWHLITRLTADLPDGLYHQLETVDVALSQISTAGVDRELARGSGEVLDRHEALAFFGLAEAMLDQTHHHAA